MADTKSRTRKKPAPARKPSAKKPPAKKPPAKKAKAPRTKAPATAAERALAAPPSTVALLGVALKTRDAAVLLLREGHEPDLSLLPFQPTRHNVRDLCNDVLRGRRCDSAAEAQAMLRPVLAWARAGGVNVNVAFDKEPQINTWL